MEPLNTVSFSNWSDGEGRRTHHRSSMNETYTANFTIHTLTTSATHRQAGRSILQERWYNRGETVDACDGEYGYSFTGWSGSASGQPTCPCHYDGVKTYANFHRVVHPTVNVSLPIWALLKSPTQSTYAICSCPNSNTQLRHLCNWTGVTGQQIL
jgi:hypothetical protein